MTVAVLSRMPAGDRQDLLGRTFAFAAAMMKLQPRLLAVGPAHAHIARQLFEAASGIGAALEEGQVAASRRDMAAKYAIGLREARESRRWLRLAATDDAWAAELKPHIQEASEFVAILTTSVRKLRQPPL